MDPRHPKELFEENCAFLESDRCSWAAMRTIAKAHQACRHSPIPNRSIRIKSVGTKPGSFAIHIGITDIYLQQCLRHYAFRASIVIQNDFSFSAPIEDTHNRFQSEHLFQQGDAVALIAVQKSRPQIRAVEKMPSGHYD